MARKALFNGILSSTFFVASLVVSSAEARRGCLVTESLPGSVHTGSYCTILERPVFVTELYTFPNLGTRSYEVNVWRASVKLTTVTTFTSVTQTTNRCAGVIVDTRSSSYDSESSEVLSLENPNTDENISNVEELENSASTEWAEAEFEKLLDRCGYRN